MKRSLFVLTVLMLVASIAYAATTPGSFLLRRDTKANWTSANPALSSGEQGYEQPAIGKPARMKVGDGSTSWASLPYFGLPATVIYASQAGCVLNTNLDSGGGTDDTAALQAALDTASTVGRLKLVVDGPALTTGLYVSSNTEIEFLPGAGLFLKAGSNKPMIQGKHPTAYGGTVTDQNIIIRGGYLNGNGANQADTDASNNYVVGVAFYGVKWLTMERVHIHDSRAWGAAVWYASYVKFIDHEHSLVPGSTRISQDGIDVRGPSDHILIRGGRFNCYDDAIAFNAKDYGGARAYGGQYTGDGGAITDVSIENVTLDDTLFGIDILTDTYLVDRISIDGVHGTSRNYFLSFSNYPYGPYPAPTTKGNFGSITVNNVDAVATGTPFLGGNDGTYNEFENIRIQASIKKLSISNFKTAVTVDYRPQIRIMPGGYTVNQLSLSGFDIYDTTVGGTVGYPRIQLEGTIDRFSINGANWYRGGAFAKSGDFVGLISGGISSSLTVSGATVNRVGSLVKQTSGSLPAVTIFGSRLDDSSTGYILNSTTANTALVTAGNKTDGTEVGGTNAGGVTVTH